MRALLLMIVTYILISMMTSCRSVQYVPMPTTSTDSTYKVVRERDSIFIHDSIYVDVQRGQDTVYRYTTKWRTIYKDVHRTDTLYVASTDSIPVVVEVEKKLSKWGEIKQTIGGYAILIILAFVAIKLIIMRVRKGF